MRQANVELQIEELVLEGFDPGDGHVIGAAVERELARLLTEEGVPPSLVENSRVPHVDGGSFELERASDAQIIGARLAQAVYEGICHCPER
jgi:hypothetical protein